MVSNTLDEKLRINIQWIRSGGRHYGNAGNGPVYDMEVLFLKGNKICGRRYEQRVPEESLLRRLEREFAVAQKQHSCVEVAYHCFGNCSKTLEKLSAGISAIARPVGTGVEKKLEGDAVVQYWGY